MSGRSLIVVPPFLKAANGPLLGPAMLVGAARNAGYPVGVLDLNARYLRKHLPPPESWPRSDFVGDHDRPDVLLRLLETQFAKDWLQVDAGNVLRGPEDLLAMRLAFDDLRELVHSLAQGRFAGWVRSQLEQYVAPPLVGVSVMYAGQVLSAMVVSTVARDLWPGSLIVWGGAHVTALAPEIAADERYGVVADRFVAGYAEKTFADLLEAVDTGAQLPESSFVAGCGLERRAEADLSVIPVFGTLDGYPRSRLSLPAQTARGCAYGRCRFCTYPAIESTRPSSLGRGRDPEQRSRTASTRDLSPDSYLSVVQLAAQRAAKLSFKDSLVPPKRLGLIADYVAGRVAWSACTKLSRVLDESFLRRLVEAGCGTLEIGVETMSPAAQAVIDKPQSWELLAGVIAAAAAAGMPVVLNYMTGLPGVETSEEEHWLSRVRNTLAESPRLVAKLSLSTFELERRAPMASDRSLYPRATGRWPWASILELGT